VDPAAVAVLHDLRTPLTVMVGRLQLLRRRLRQGPPDPVQLAADLDAIAAATVRMTWALDALAAGAWSTSGDGNPDPVGAAGRAGFAAP
jgi:K+-sensing histidine kinase KdpD